MKQEKLFVDIGNKAVKGYCKGKEGFKRQIEILKGK